MKNKLIPNKLNLRMVTDNYRISNNKIVHIMKQGIKLSFIWCMVAIFVLVLYCENATPQAFYIGISLFKTGLFYATMVTICGIVFNKRIQ